MFALKWFVEKGKCQPVQNDCFSANWATKNFGGKNFGQAHNFGHFGGINFGEKKISAEKKFGEDFRRNFFPPKVYVFNVGILVFVVGMSLPNCRNLGPFFP